MRCRLVGMLLAGADTMLWQVHNSMVVDYATGLQGYRLPILLPPGQVHMHESADKTLPSETVKVPCSQFRHGTCI